MTDTGCSTLTWEPFVQHVEGLVECPLPSSAVGITSIPSTEEIAGIRTTSDIRCAAGACLVPPDPRPGDDWTSSCRGSGETVAVDGRVVGWSSVTIGGDRVPTLDVRVDMRYSGTSPA